MFRETRRALIALSGGKDSAALLDSLVELDLNIELIPFHIDLGIPGYSDHCRKAVEQLCRRLGYKPLVFRLETEGFTISEVSRRYRKPCSPCGTIKRYWMNRIALEQNVDVVVTGHNLDLSLIHISEPTRPY